MGMINMVKRSAASVQTPDVGRIVLYADSTTGQPMAKDSSGSVYTFVGPNGLRGSNWTTGTVVPTTSGLAGDMYLKTDNGAVYQNTGATSWVLVGNITGPQGPAVPLATSAPTDVSASASSPGSATTASKSDHTHFHGNQAGGALHAAVTTGVNGFMLSTDKSKLDAYGSLSSTTPTTDAPLTGAVGVSTALARADHQHAHGVQTDGTLHAAVTGSTNGFMISTDKTKLDTYGALSTTTPTTDAALTGAVGVSTTLARSDHQHAHGVQTDGTLHSVATGSLNGFMSSTDKTRFDGVLPASTVTTVGSAQVVGTSTAYARQDHVHDHGNQAGGALHAVVTGSVNGFMSSTDKTRFDTVTPASTVTTIGAAQVVGTSTMYARQDHVHDHGNQAGGTLHSAVVAGGANGFMLGTDKTKLDTYGSLSIAAPPSTGAASAIGTSTNLAREDHTHAHGNLPGGALHALATSAAAGFMSATDKSKFDSGNLGLVNIMDYGGDAGGTNSNTAAINAAVAALGTAGGVVFFPPGDYAIGAAVTVATGGTVFVGGSKNNTRLKATFATGDVLTFNEYYCGIQNLQLATNVTRTSGYMVQAPQPYFRAKELLIYGVANTAPLFGGIELGTTSILSSCEDIEIRHFTGVAISVNGAGDKVLNRIVCDNVAANTAQAGIRVTNTASLLLNECNLIHCGNALDVAPTTGVTIPSIKATNCFFDNSVNGLNMSTAGSFLRSEFTNCWFSSMSNAGINLLPTTAGGINGITFVNCDVLNNIAGTTTGINTNANVGKWRLSSSQIAGWTVGINLVPGAAHYPSLLGNSIGAIAAFGNNGTGLVMGSGTYRGYTIRNNDVTDNNVTWTIGTIAATTPDLAEMGNNPGAMQQGVLVTLASPITTASGTLITAISARIPANAALVGQAFKFRALAQNGATAATAFSWQLKAGTAGTVADATVTAITVTAAIVASGKTYIEGIATVRSATLLVADANVVNQNAASTTLAYVAPTPAAAIAAGSGSQTIATTGVWYLTLAVSMTGGAGTIQQAVIEAL